MARRFNYSKVQGTASRLMSRFKQGKVTLTRKTPGERPLGSNPWDPPPAERISIYDLDATAKAVSDKFINGTLIFATDIEITAGVTMTLEAVDGVPVAPAPVQLELLPGDTLNADGQPVTIITTMRIPRVGTPVVWKFIVRG